MTINSHNLLFDKARNETLSYHKLYYSRHQLFEEDSWLAKPDSGLMKLLEEELIPRAREALSATDRTTSNAKSKAASDAMSKAKSDATSKAGSAAMSKAASDVTSKAESDATSIAESKATSNATSQAPLYRPEEPIRILDLGCGVGRNAIPMAMALAKAGVAAKITGVDVLAESIDLLAKNSTTYGVETIVEGLVVDNDQFVIEPEGYDLIAAISVVEHCAGRAKVLRLLKAIASGLRPGGLVRIEMTTDRNVVDLGTKQAVPTHVETPLSERQVIKLLEEAFQGFAVLSRDVFAYKEVLDKDGKKLLWQSKQVSFSGKAK